MYLYGPIHGTTLPHKPDRPRRRRLPPEAFYATAEPCESCGEQTYRGRIWNAEHELWAAVDCSCNVPDVLPSCPTRYALVCEAATINQMCLALRAHEAECVHCGCTKKTVVSDRLTVNPAAVCCERMVA